MSFGQSPTPEIIRVEPASRTIEPEEMYQLQAIGEFADGTTENFTGRVTWETENRRIATVERGLVTAIQPGQVFIFARFGDLLGRSDVRVADVIGLRIEPVEAVINIDESMAFAAFARFAMNSGEVQVTSSADWVSSNTAIVEIDDSGVVTGIRSGVATITASLGDQTATAELTVNAPPVAMDDQTTTQQAEPVTFSVIDNDVDPDGMLFAATVDLDPSASARQTSVVVPGEGMFTADDMGNVTFTPEDDFARTSAISYTVEDDQGAISNAAAITVTVVNVPPLAMDDQATTQQDTPVTISVTANDPGVGTHFLGRGEWLRG
ncbi:Ig-like domain-containing protein [Candidatus Entotheonella palauensis]|uniref:Ig-like domain-containing protein n=1 Tax=Candidatus Entotheonella palauensis TaxID=93172 RepID=UPI0015C44E6F|nr:Ig-like domain-containing protein [Candidatus Entotheonella palauensis]